MSAPSQLLSQIQALQAKVNTLNAAASQTAAGVSSAASSSSGINWLTVTEVVSTGSSKAAVPWTSYTSNQVPSGASCVILVVTARRDLNTTGFQYIYARASASSTPITIYGSNSNGVDTDTEGSTAQYFAPCSGGTFEWMMNPGIAPYWITLVGYFQ